MSARPLILASRSARRARLLTEAGYVFEQVDPPFEDDPHPPAGDPQHVAMELARAKAISVSGRDGIILAADTLIVNPDGTLAGTPTDTQQAAAMVRAFVGRRHVVVTGVAIRGAVRGDQMITFADTAQVDVGQITDEQIDRYVASGDWRGKAGGYNLFERRADGWPILVEGDETTVVGLPMTILAEHLPLKAASR